MERLESQILEQESEISNVENRACFAVHCIQLETQLVYANMEVLSSVLLNLAENERIAHSEVRIPVVRKGYLELLLMVIHLRAYGIRH